jgi:hypothetical protein
MKRFEVIQVGRSNTMSGNDIRYSQLKPGSIIQYVLRDEEQPTSPFKKWSGKIVRVNIDKPGTLDHVYVESLEPGYEGYNEYVLIDQIIAVSEASDN